MKKLDMKTFVLPVGFVQIYENSSPCTCPCQSLSMWFSLVTDPETLRKLLPTGALTMQRASGNGGVNVTVKFWEMLG